MNRSHDNTLKDLGILAGKGVGSGNLAGKGVESEEQPIRGLIAFIAVEYGVRSYGFKPIESSVTNQQ